MYGNFDAIKRRQKLRKEKTDSSSSRLDKRKSSLLAIKKGSIEQKHSDLEVQKAITDIQSKSQNDQKKNFKIELIIWFLSIGILVFLIAQLMPWLFF